LQSRLRRDEIARGSVIEIDTAIGIAVDLKYCLFENLHELGEFIVKTFKQLSGLITSSY